MKDYVSLSPTPCGPTVNLKPADVQLLGGIALSLTMLPRRLFLRASQRISIQACNPVVRFNVQRRFATTGEAPLTGTADNAFNRERQAVKAHAAATSGKRV